MKIHVLPCIKQYVLEEQYQKTIISMTNNLTDTIFLSFDILTL